MALGALAAVTASQSQSDRLSAARPRECSFPVLVPAPSNYPANSRLMPLRVTAGQGSDLAASWVLANGGGVSEEASNGLLWEGQKAEPHKQKFFFLQFET